MSREPKEKNDRSDLPLRHTSSLVPRPNLTERAVNIYRSISATKKRMAFPAPCGSGPVWQRPRLAAAPSGSGPVWQRPRLAAAPSGSGPVWQRPRLAAAPSGSGPVWQRPSAMWQQGPGYLALDAVVAS